MNLDMGTLLYEPLYAMFGTDAVVRCTYGGAFAVRVIDLTSGVEVSEGSGLDIKSIRPAAAVMVSELTSVGLARADLEDALIEINNKLWKVKATMPKPSPSGEASGELYLFLIEDEE